MKAKYPNPNQYLNLKICKQLHKTLERSFPDKSKININFEARYPNKLEAILGNAITASQYQQYDFVELAVYYLVKFARRHPFLDCNKRAAVIYFVGYLYFEGYKLKLSPYDLYEFLILVTELKQINENELIDLICHEIKQSALLVKI